MRFGQISIIVSAFALTSCGGQFEHPDTSSIDAQITVRPFYRDLFSPSDATLDAKIARMDSLYGTFFTDFCEYGLRIGRPTDSLFSQSLNTFLTLPENAEVLPVCDSVYAQLSIDDQLTDAFRCIEYYMPHLPVPQVYCHFSGFSQKIIVDSTFISFGIEHYLGSQCRFYQYLEVPLYARHTKSAEYIVSDIVKGWYYANCPDVSEKDDILSAMIYQAKILYATKASMPSLDLTKLFGFTEKQLEWCEKAEADMWAYLAENKLLYSTDQLVRNKLVRDAPFTQYFGQDSPGRAVLYCAFSIVCDYMRQHPETTMPELFAMADAQKILVEARYRP
ncbi:MAG: hypothetical protein J6Y82_12880 [Bacteroidales bacterium]|nr:hypothetical protein [Bacteroidales bacterium]